MSGGVFQLLGILQLRPEFYNNSIRNSVKSSFWVVLELFDLKPLWASALLSLQSAICYSSVHVLLSRFYPILSGLYSDFILNVGKSNFWVVLELFDLKPLWASALLSLQSVICYSSVHILLFRFYCNFILIIFRFYPDFCKIPLYSNFLQISL